MKTSVLVLLFLLSNAALAFEWQEPNPPVSAEAKRLLNYAFDTKAPYQTNGLVLIKGDQVIVEHYANNFSKTSPHLLWSVSKSFANALVGLAIGEGKFTLETKAAKYEPLLQREGANLINIKDLLQMSSGIDWNEGYEGNPLKSNVVRMLYLGGQPNMGAYTAQIPMKMKPQERFNYSSGESNLLCHILRRALGDDETYQNYPWDKLFGPLGITSATWERDGSGNFVCSSYLYMTPRDAARFGKLYVDKGQWEGETILSPEWIKMSGEMAPAFLKTELEGFANREGYGLHWWLNHDLPSKGLARPFPSAPENILLAEGHHGQLIVVIPDQKAVLVRTGQDKKETIDKDTLLKLALKVMEQTP